MPVYADSDVFPGMTELKDKNGYEPIIETA